jgi:hypothetical protein
MRWVVDGAPIAALVVGLWILAPTVRSFFGPHFGPSWRNDASVFYAEQSSHP